MRVKNGFFAASIERSVAFYRDVLGFKVDFEMPGPDGKIAHAEVSGESGTIMFDRLDWLPEEARANLTKGTGVQVDVEDLDIDAFYERVRSMGATVTQELEKQFWGRHFWIADPDGNRLQFVKVIRQVNPQEKTGALSAV